MRGFKQKDVAGFNPSLQEDWPWTNIHYEFIIKEKYKNIEKVIIDPTGRLADVEIANNVFEVNDK